MGALVDAKYRVEAQLGSGAMGVVYRGRHEALDRPVALKVLRHLRSRDELLVRRFRREARMAAKLSHPHSVQVQDFGEDRTSGFLYLAMELVEGESLMDVIRRHRTLSARRVARLMLQVSSALEAAHRLEMIHRDVKPANILVTEQTGRDGRPVEIAKVCDFGLAKITTEHADPGATNDPKIRAAGTPVYMSPEQAIGEPLDPRTDIYSCGVVLHHLLAGKPPFLASRPFEILMAHVSEEPVLLRRVAPEVPASLERLVAWCLVKNRDARCPDAQTLRDALREVAVELGEPVTDEMAVELGEPVAQDRAPAWKSLSADLTLEPAVESGQAAPVDPAAAEPMPIPLPADAILDAPPLPADAILEPVAEPDADIDALVARAVAEVEAPKDVHRQHAQEHQMAGLDRGRHSDAVAERAAYVYTRYGITYEPYRGAHPFWARDHRGELLGPFGHDDLFRVIERSGELGTARQVLVSADEERWMTADAFIRLVGLEILLEGKQPRREPSVAIWSGSVARTGLVSVFARMARERGSGRLFLRRGHEDGERGEIHVINGRPTFVYSNREGLQIPDLLVSQGLLEPDLLAGFLRRALLEESPLEAVIGREAGIDVGQWNTRFMQERLRSIFPWTGGEFYFDRSEIPMRLEPFAPSLLSVTRDLVYRGMTEAELEAWGRRWVSAPLQPSQWFAEGCRQLRLPEAQARMARRMLRRRTLGEAVDAEGPHRRLALTLAYIFFEADILLKPL